MIRLLKAVLVLFVGLQGLFYGLQNIVNMKAAYSFVEAVLTMQGHALYTEHFLPAITSPALIWTALYVIVAGEILVGLIGFKGALDLATKAGATSEHFNASKTWALLSCGAAMVLWFGLFMVFGGAYFQMWQTELGGASFNGAFQYALISGLVMIFVNMPDR